MTFNITPRETLSRCDYSNKFQTYTGDVEAKLKAIRSHQAHLDVQETESARLERMMMQKFTKGFFRQEGDQYAFVKKVGKFIFVAVLLPPYFAVYLAPKWVIQYGLPFVADLGQNGFSRLFTLVTSAADWLARISGQLLERFNKLFQIHLLFPFNIGKSSRDLARRFLERIKGPLSRLAAPWQKVRRRLEEEGKRQRQKWHTFWEKLRKKIGEKMKFTLPVLSLPTISLPRFTLPRLPKLPLPLLTQKLAQIGHPLLQGGQALARFFWDILRVNYQNWIEPYIQWVVPLGHWVQRQAQRSYEKLAAPLKLVGPFIAKALDRLRKITAPLFAISYRPLLQKTQAIFKGFAAKAQIGAKGKRWFLQKLGSTKSLLTRQGENFRQATTRTVFGVVSSLKRAFKKGGSLLAHTGSFLWAFSAFLKELGQAILLAYIVLKVLCRLALQNLKI